MHTPEFIFEEIAHHADLVRTILVLDNLEEKDFFALRPGTLNLCHMRMVIKTVAKFHAVSLAYKQALFSAFSSQSAQAKANRQVDEVIMEGDNKVLTGRFGLFARFPFLSQRLGVLAYLIENRHTFLDMFGKLLSCFGEEDEHLLDIFEYLRLSFDDILLLSEDLEGKEYEDSPLDAITLGVLESRSFLFKYTGDESKESDRKKKNSKLQRSQSERIKDRSRLNRDPSNPKSPGVGKTIHLSQHPHPKHGKHKDGSTSPGIKAKMPASPKCPKLDMGESSLRKNKFLQNVIGKSKDDEKVQITTRRASRAQKERDPNDPPRSAALVNAKYVTYGRVTRDLAVVFWTAAPSLVRRFYLVKMVECYVETLGITLGQLGIDTDAFGLKYQQVLEDFQKHLLYGFGIAVLMAMATTSPEELEAYYQRSVEERAKKGNNLNSHRRRRRRRHEEMDIDEQQQQNPNVDVTSKYLPLTEERVSYLRDLMRDAGSYVESRDFELGLPVTNFARYHELWSMADDEEDDDDDDVEDSQCDEEEEQYESAEED